MTRTSGSSSSLEVTVPMLSTPQMQITGLQRDSLPPTIVAVA